MVLASWRPHPVMDAAVALAIAGYVWLGGRGVRAERWPWRRTGCWLLALLVLLVAVDGPIGIYGEALFWVHMVQHLLLIMVVAVLLVWAQPLRLLGGPRLDRVLGSRVVRSISHPLIALCVYTAVVVFTHLTGFQQAAATHGGVRAGELALYLVAGWLYFLPLVGAELAPWSPPFLLRFVLLALGMGADTLTGVALMLTREALAPAYGAARAGWGPSPLADQHIAGAVMWFAGDLLMMMLMILVVTQWGRAGQERQGLGEWLEVARRRAVLGDTAAGADLDDDQKALDAYNATLAALHSRQPRNQRPHDYE